MFVVRTEAQSSDFIRRKCIKYGIQNIKIIELDYMTDGQATTCMFAILYCNFCFN